MSAELVVHTDTTPETLNDPTGGRLVAWAHAASAANQLAQALTTTTFVPAHFKNNVGDATAAILMGDELGLSPLAAFRSIYVVHGTPALYARGMVALAQAHGHEIWTDKSTDAEVTVKGRRKGSEQIETATWTIKRAATAGYTNNKKYATDPQAMLYSKAAAEVCRKVAADALAGVPYSVEDLELEEQGPTTRVTRSTSSTRVSRKKPDAGDPLPQSGADVDPNPVAAEFATDGITEQQRKALHALVNDLGLDRGAKLAGVAAVIGREIASTSDLSKDEATKVIKSLKETLAASEVVQGELMGDLA